MPMKSQAQRGAMYAAKAGKSTLGIPRSVGAEFVKSDTGGKLPRKVKKDTRNYAKGGPVFGDEITARQNEANEFFNAVDAMRDKEQQSLGSGPSTTAPANEPPPQDVPDEQQNLQTG
jgi:hypothetical protein